jgi:hypothetical protein
VSATVGDLTLSDGWGATMTSTITEIAALPSLRGMTPAEARAAEVLGMAWDPAEMVELAIEWVGDGQDAATLVDLAGRGWDDPALPGLWDRALDELTEPVPARRTAQRRCAAYLARRTGGLAARIPAPRLPARGCPHCASVGA